jgi:quinol monooxygenase YgiN
MSKFLLHGTLLAKDGKRDELTDIMTRAATLMLTQAKGCELYAVGHKQGDENTVYITEIWASKEDHAASLKVAGVQELIGEAMPILAEMPTPGQEIILVNL